MFAPVSSAGLPAGLERLTIEMVNLSIQETQDLWAGRLRGCWHTGLNSAVKHLAGVQVVGNQS